MINMTKFGFVRTPEEDFIDDGTRFTCYQLGNVRITKALADGLAYIDGEMYNDNRLPYKTRWALPHADAVGKLNGVPVAEVTDKALAQLAEDCKAYEQEYEDAVKNTKYPTIEDMEAKYNEIKQVKVKRYNMWKYQFTLRFDSILAKLNSSEIKYMIETMQDLWNEINTPFDKRFYSNQLGQLSSITFMETDLDYKDWKCQNFEEKMKKVNGEI